MTLAEKALWTHLSNRQLGGLRFRRQHVIGHYITDFYCHSHRLVLEIDGSSHNHKKEYDLRREKQLMRQGYSVLRFTNVEVFKNLEQVLERILRFCTESTMTVPALNEAKSPYGEDRRSA